MNLLSIFLAITASPVLNAIIWIVVMSLIFYILWWALGALGIPEPFNKVLRAVIILAAVIVLIYFLLGLLGNPF